MTSFELFRSLKFKILSIFYIYFIFFLVKCIMCDKTHHYLAKKSHKISHKSLDRESLRKYISKIFYIF